MPDDHRAALRSSSARLGGLRGYGNKPDPKVLAAAERDYATNRIYCEMRDALARSGPLEPTQVSLLAFYLIGESGVSRDQVAILERVIRAAVEAAQGGGSL